MQQHRSLAMYDRLHRIAHAVVGGDSLPVLVE